VVLHEESGWGLEAWGRRGGSCGVTDVSQALPRASTAPPTREGGPDEG
jgi:hypothetical protein